MAKATAKTKAPDSTKPLAKGGAVAFVNPKALMIDVGEKALKAWADTKLIGNQISALTEKADVGKRQTLNLLSMAFVHAANNDKNINLNHAVTEDKAAMADMRERLFVAVGLKSEIINADGTKKIDWAPMTHEYFPHREEKGSDAWRKKETFRTNFSAQFTKAAQAAAAIMQMGINATNDKATGNLMISGKAVRERFGVDQVLLNEKQTVSTGEGTQTKLKAIPSFTELARMAHEKAGKTLKTRVDSRAKTAVLGEGEVVASVKSITTIIENLKNFGDELADCLEKLADACQDAIDRNGTEEATKPAA